MKQRIAFINLSLLAIFLVLAFTPALASSTWFADGVHGSDNNNCKSRLHACKTIGHAISLAHSDDSIRVAAATYTENLSISLSLKIVGSSAKTTIIDGGRHGTVVAIPDAKAHVMLLELNIRNGFARGGGGIYNSGTLTVKNSTLKGNKAFTQCTSHACFVEGGGIFNLGTLTLNNSTLSGNSARRGGGGLDGTATLQNSIVANNSGANCLGTMTSNGYNLSSDTTCNFNNTGDLNNTDPKLGVLQNNGGPTQTQALLSGSPAIDAGYPNGCTDGQGHLLPSVANFLPRLWLLEPHVRYDLFPGASASTIQPGIRYEDCG